MFRNTLLFINTADDTSEYQILVRPKNTACVILFCRRADNAVLNKYPVLNAFAPFPKNVKRA